MKNYYLIAETAYSFEGDREYLLEQIAGLPDDVSAVKFHLMLDVDSYVVESFSIRDTIRQWLLSEDEWKRIFMATHQKKKDIIALVDDLQSIAFLRKFPDYITGIEVHSACVNDIRILDAALSFAEEYQKTFFLGISGFRFAELQRIVRYIQSRDIQIVLMYGFQNYPTRLEDLQLNKIGFYRNCFDLEIGYADHTQADLSIKDTIICAAYASGVKFLEVHCVNEFNHKKTDYITAYDAQHFKGLIEKLNAVRTAVGDFEIELNEGEINYLNFRKVPVYARNYDKKHQISVDDILFKRVNKAQENHYFLDYKEYIGKSLAKSVQKDEEVMHKDFVNHD